MTSQNIIPDYRLLGSVKKGFEGFAVLAYKDSGGIWTVGYGSTYNHTHDRKVREGDVVSQATAEEWMKKDTVEIVRLLNLYIKVPQNSAQSTALVDYVYNRGIKNFLNTQLDELINSKAPLADIAKEFVGTGLKDRLGNLLWGLGRRRRCEAYLYCTGILKTEWPRWGTFTIK